MARIPRIGAILAAVLATAMLWAVLDRSLAIALLPLWLLLVPLLSGSHPGEEIVLRVLRANQPPRATKARAPRRPIAWRDLPAHSRAGGAPVGSRAPPPLPAF